MFAVVYCIPKFFEFDRPSLTEGEMVLNPTPMRENKYYKKIYVFWSKFILIELFPYFTIILLNTLILMKTLKAAKFRRRFRQQASTTANSSSTGNINAILSNNARNEISEAGVKESSIHFENRSEIIS